MIIVRAATGTPLLLGREGENLVRQVVFDVSEWRKLYGAGTVRLIAQRSGDVAPYPCVIGDEGDTVSWTITNADTAHPSNYGKCELSYYVGERLAKSETWRTIVLDALGEPSADAPEPYQSWVDAVLEAAEHTYPFIQDGTWWTWDADAREYVNTGIVAAGTDGKDGKDGADGVGIASVARTSGDGSAGTTDVYTITFTDETTTIFSVYNGKDGDIAEIPEDAEERIATLESQMAELLYTAIAISSFSHNAGTKEMGSTLSSVKLTWATNKTPTALTLDGATIDVSLTSTTLSGLSITANKTWTLIATDERDATATKTTTVSFLNGVYYGAAEVPDTLDSAFILGLSKTLTSSRARTITVDVADGQYAWYCLPTRLGSCTFTVGGFEGGFDLVDTISFTNASGYPENYYVYRSSNPSLGSTKVVVT